MGCAHEPSSHCMEVQPCAAMLDNNSKKIYEQLSPLLSDTWED